MCLPPAADMLHHAYDVKKPPSNDDPSGLIQLGLTEHVSFTRVHHLSHRAG